MKQAIKTVGLNTVIFKDSSDLNNITFEVVKVKSWKDKQVIHRCGNFADALAVAQDNI